MSELTKTAARVIRVLNEQKENVMVKLASYDEAFQLVGKMVESGAIASEQTLSKYAELREKAPEELEILDKALEITKEASFSSNSFSLGVAGDIDDGSALSPEAGFADYLKS